jgi:hypothetical protein
MLALYEAGWLCQGAIGVPSQFEIRFVHGSPVTVRWGRSREVRSALYSRSSRARDARRRMRGFEGRGRHHHTRRLAELRIPIPAPAG